MGTSEKWGFEQGAGIWGHTLTDRNQYRRAMVGMANSKSASSGLATSGRHGKRHQAASFRQRGFEWEQTAK
jgi:hypothetical protein